MKKVDFCCKKMRQEQKEIRDENLVDHSIIYNQRYRSFYIYLNEEAEQRDREMLTDIFWCPWCGEKLPKELSDEWWDILDNEYDIKDPRDSESDNVPVEFWTDEWWKKRGL